MGAAQPMGRDPWGLDARQATHVRPQQHQQAAGGRGGQFYIGDGAPSSKTPFDDKVAVTELPHIDECTIKWLFEPAWSPDRISESGRASLQAHGVTVPEHGTPAPQKDGMTPLRTPAIPCPWCGSTNTRLDSAFGPTRCRTIQYCDECQNTFEDMKRLEAD